MSIIGIIAKVSFKCFDLLAWPLFALIYPLCASIQAIETNSKSDTEKLVVYWICFALILLFDHAFANLLQWLPSWPYIKLAIIWCLVIPKFNGSACAYKHLVNSHILYNLFIKFKSLFNSDNLRIEAKREDTETKAHGSSTDLKAIHMNPDMALQGNITCSSLEIKDLIIDKTISGKQNVEASKIPQTWNCALCKVTTSGIKGLVSHFQGKRHDDALQKLKIELQTSKLNAVCATGAESESAETVNIPDKQNVYGIQLPWTCSICRATLKGETSLVSHLQGKRHKESCERIQAWNSEVWQCTICNVRCSSQRSLENHFYGSKHLAKTIELSGRGGNVQG
ncbi:uncharacterized protein LOC126661467 [Mercurialis annua]|uniref:uncharacterized protein LOC126661467 n=1 Tax=Mercurialis annua TaxID=3986 RepID=UPI0021604E27|nr:uncharacterized protein LOC126661467 [Mercurialis annua]